MQGAGSEARLSRALHPRPREAGAPAGTRERRGCDQSQRCAGQPPATWSYLTTVRGRSAAPRGHRPGQRPPAPPLKVDSMSGLSLLTLRSFSTLLRILFK